MLQINIESKDEKPLMSRTELRGVVAFDGSTPSRAEVRAEIAKAMKTKDENVIVRSLSTAYGNTTADLVAYVYKNAEDAKTITLNHIVKRNSVEKKKEEKEKKEVPVETPAKAETSAEESPAKKAPADKEEAPAEGKSE